MSLWACAKSRDLLTAGGVIAECHINYKLRYAVVLVDVDLPYGFKLWQIGRIYGDLINTLLCVCRNGYLLPSGVNANTIVRFLGHCFLRVRNFGNLEKFSMDF